MRQIQIFKVFKNDYNDRENDIQEMFDAVGEDQGQTQERLINLETLCSLIKNYMTDQGQDKEKLKNQLYALERHTQSQLKTAQTNIEAKLMKVTSSFKSQTDTAKSQRYQRSGASVKKQVES